MNTKPKAMRTESGQVWQWTLCALALAGAPWVVAQPALSVATLPGYPGATVSLPLSLRQVTNVTAAQFDVAFNPAKVASGELLPGAVFPDHVVRSREIAPGVRRVLVFSRVNAAVTVTNRHTLGSLTFAVSSTEYVGSGPIRPEGVVLARPDATAITPVTLNAGAIFVQPVNLGPAGAQFFLPSEPGSNYVIQATTDFMDWVNISTNLATSDFLDLMDAEAGNFPWRFYRWVIWP
jgi:hypothetical protein